MASSKSKIIALQSNGVYREKFSVGLRQYRGSLKTSDRAEAEAKATVNKRIAEQDYELQRLEAAGLIDKQKRLVDVTLAQALDRYMTEHGDKCAAAASMGTYNARLREFFGDSKIFGDIDADQMKKFRTWMQAKETSKFGVVKLIEPRTINAHMNHFRAVQGQAPSWNVRVTEIKWGGNKREPGVLLRQPKKPKSIISGAVQFEKITQAIEEKAADLMPLFRFALMTSIRQENCYALPKVNVQWEQERILFMQKSITPGGEPHYVPITPKIATLLRAQWSHHPDFVFTYVCERSHTGAGAVRRKGVRYPMTATVLRDRWMTVRKEVGAMDLNWHRIRATAATFYFNKTKDAGQVMQLTGHRDLESFLLYIDANTDIDKVRGMMMTFDIEDALLAMRAPSVKPDLKVVGS